MGATGAAELAYSDQNIPCLAAEGADTDGVFKAIEFLINMNRGFEVDIGQRVIVVGGGDVAMDTARTALRATDYDNRHDDESSMRDAIDVARSAALATSR